MSHAYINQIATAVPDYDVHQSFITYVCQLLKDDRRLKLFQRLVQKSGIEKRYSFFEPGASQESLEKNRFYKSGFFPETGERMRLYQQNAFTLAKKACDQLNLNAHATSITHVIITSCTGFYAPGLDVDIVQHYGLSIAVERTVVGFMGCSAALNALKLARHIVLSDVRAKILIVNVELCTLHLQDTDDLEQLLSFLIFADGAAASLISAESTGIRINDFHSMLIPATTDQLTWQIGKSGFNMVLSGQVPLTITANLPHYMAKIMSHGSSDIQHWAVHPGGRSVLDAVQNSLELPATALDISREILRNYGNMSSATIMFVLQKMFGKKGQGCALAFGPGITAETMMFDA